MSQGIEALRDHVEDAGIVQIIPQGFIERLEQVGVLGILSGCIEIRHRQANLFNAQPGTGFDPVLSEARGQQKQR